MSYTAVPTVATGDVWTASNHNLYIRDNFRAVVPDVVTTKGQMVIGDGADALALLGIGSDNKMLMGDLSWKNKTEIFQFHIDSAWGPSDGSFAAADFSASGSGNYHVPGYFGVPEGVAWVYCMIRLLESVSTAYFALYPSYDTTVEGMGLNALGSTIMAQSYGIMPLDSTGGLFYLNTDTSTLATLSVFGYMY